MSNRPKLSKLSKIKKRLNELVTLIVKLSEYINNYQNVLFRSRNHRKKTQQIPCHPQIKDFETIVEMRDPISIRDQCQRNALLKTRIF